MYGNAWVGESDEWIMLMNEQGIEGAQQTLEISCNAAQMVDPTVDPWSAMNLNPPASGADAWLNAGGGDPVSAGFHFSGLWDGSLRTPVEGAIDSALGWMSATWRPFFQTLRVPIDYLQSFVVDVLQGTPILLMLAIIGLIAWQLAGRVIAAGAVIAMAALAMLGLWHDTMLTLALVLTSLFFCILIGLPLGVLMATNKSVERVMRSLLDTMQTTPSFVYLVPIAILFGTGDVPGIIVTIFFALPPLVRMTNLGLRQVRPDLIEAARAYGASRWQMLSRVQMPLAMPSIMAGINQSLMLAMSMVVVASMISVAGLGQMVYLGVNNMKMGLATMGGIGIVILAIVLDRVSQAMGQRKRGVRHWWQTGPAGIVYRLVTAGRKDNAVQGS